MQVLVANDLKAAGYTPGDLVRAGYNPSEVMPGGVAGLANCSVEALRQARAQGVSADEIRRRGCSLQAMLAAGYTPAELKAAGFSDDDLRQWRQSSGFTRANAQLVSVSPMLLEQQGLKGYRHRRKRGCSVSDAGSRIHPEELKAAGFSDDDLRAIGISPGAAVAAPGMIGAAAAAPGMAGAAAAPGIAGTAAIPSVGNTELQLSQLQANQERQLNQQQKDQKMTQVQTSMVSQANSLFTTWTPPAQQQYVAGEAPKETAAVTTTTQGATTTATRGPFVGPGGVVAVPAGPGSGGPIAIPAGSLGPGGVAVPAVGPGGAVTPETCADVKAGDIMMAVLTNTVNSDENSPVMATIVSGKLRGAKLIGRFTLLKKQVMVNFDKMDMPGKPASIGINAVAIDPETAHTALADCVNNHYLQRYGGLFASSFLSGLADAISQQGSQTSISTGGILVTHDKLSAGQTLAVALGAVGSQYAAVLGSDFTRPPTVFVYAGDSIGILFMQDLTVTDQCCPDIDKTCNISRGGQVCMPHY